MNRALSSLVFLTGLLLTSSAQAGLKEVRTFPGLTPIAPVLPADDGGSAPLPPPHTSTPEELAPAAEAFFGLHQKDAYGDLYPVALEPGDPGYEAALQAAEEEASVFDEGETGYGDEDEGDRSSLERFALKLREVNNSDLSSFRLGGSVGGEGEGVASGSPGGGRLIRGIQFPLDHPAFLAVEPTKAYGTADTIEGLIQAVEEVRERFPGTPRIVLGDISAERGGRIRPHRSHQNGLDVDLGFFYLQGEEVGKRFEAGRSDNLDVPRTFFLVESLINLGTVQFILLDYRVQGILYAYGRDELGYPQELLDAWFGYPERGWVSGAMVRHVRGHDDHLHVRFVCPDGQSSCQD